MDKFVAKVRLQTGQFIALKYYKSELILKWLRKNHRIEQNCGDIIRNYFKSSQ